MLRAESVVSRDQDVVPCWSLASSSWDLVGASDSFFAAFSTEVETTTVGESIA